MKKSEALKLLGYISAWDNREVTNEKAEIWADGLPDWLTLGLAQEAAKAFFTQPKEGQQVKYLAPQEIILRAREVLVAQKEIEKHRAITARVERIEALPPAQGRRKEIVQGGLAGLVAAALKKVEDS